MIQARILFDERIEDLNISVDVLQPMANAADVEVLADQARAAAVEATAMVRLAIGTAKAAQVAEDEGWEKEGAREGRRWLKSAQGAVGVAGIAAGLVDEEGKGDDGEKVDAVEKKDDGERNDAGAAVDEKGGHRNNGREDDGDGNVDGEDGVGTAVDGKGAGKIAGDVADGNFGGKDDGKEDGKDGGSVDGNVDGKDGENGDKNGEGKGEKVGVLPEPQPAGWSSFSASAPRSFDQAAVPTV